MTPDLEPLAPEEAVEMYLDARRDELTKETYRKQEQRLESFVYFCDDKDIQNLNNLSGRDLYRYRLWRKEGNDYYDSVKNITVRANLATLRTFLGFAESIDAVPTGMKLKVQLPDVENESTDTFLDADRAEEILEHLDRYEYASRTHVVFAIMWRTAARAGSVRALDLEDFDPEEPCLMFRHRPETGTPLKNKERGERDVHIDSYYAQVIQDYIDQNRFERTDEHGREPLLTTEQGRPVTPTFRRNCYRVTIPCLTGPCPHNRDPETCEWTEKDERSKCPSSCGCHALRRGSITDHRNRGIPAELVSDRVDATPEVIDQHYDKRTERERMRVRRRIIEER
ncbi:MAG: site-specific integrase [Halobacteriales archaeon]|nr:site-specific integrase [Halobacteriales archaeon]